MNPSRFSVDDTILVNEERVRVAGLWRYQLNDAVVTRYALSDASGNAQLVQEQGRNLVALRSFPPAMQPTVAGQTVEVLGERYTLREVQKLKRLDHMGQVPASVLQAPLVLSGVFAAPAGALLWRELVPGAKTEAQTYYAVKSIHPEQVLDAAELATLDARRREVSRHNQEVIATYRARQEDAKPSLIERIWTFAKYGVVVVIVLVVIRACMWPSEPTVRESDADSSSGSSSESGGARGSAGIYHGK